MSRHENLPLTARAIALLLSSTPAVQDAQPGVLHQLLEFSNRYTQQVLTDARVYAEHAGRQEKVEYDDVVLAVQARVGWEFGGHVPKEYILSLATQINATPLPAVPEVFGVRLPQQSDCLTSIDFDLVPNKPPPGAPMYDEQVEEIEESESEDDEDMEPAPIPMAYADTQVTPAAMTPAVEEAPFPISAIQIDVATPSHPAGTTDEGIDTGDHEDLFGRGEDDDGSDAMEEIQTTLTEGVPNGVKRKLVEEDDYD